MGVPKLPDGTDPALSELYRENPAPIHVLGRWYNAMIKADGTEPTSADLGGGGGGGGGSFPDFTGSGSPEGVQTANVGQSYVDTANGALYFKGSGSGNTGWVEGIGTDPSGANVGGVRFTGTEATGYLALYGFGDSNVYISDVLGQNGTGNGIFWVANGTDTQQLAKIVLGNGDKITQFNADGTTTFPGPIHAPGVPVVRKFPFAFDTPGILTGAAVYTPTVGDILLDAWIEVDTAWDGTTPLADFGTFSGGSTGVMTIITVPADLTVVSPALAGNAGMLEIGSSMPEPRGFKFTAANPIKVCVSQDGTNTGADPGSTVGSATLYLVTVTPV